MKTKALSHFALVLMMACSPGLWAQGYDSLKSRVGTLYDKADRMLEAKDVDGFMSLLADDYQLLFAGKDREGLRSTLNIRFMGYSELRADHSILEITRLGDIVKVINEQKLEGKSGESWKVLSQATVIDLLTENDGVLKFCRSVEIDMSRLGNISGQTYRDDKISFSAPENWIIIPTSHPTLQGVAYVLAPDRTSAAIIGHVRAPGVTGRQAAEGDENLCKIVSTDGKYKLFKSGAIRVNGYEGFETESSFHIMLDRERHRWRVYFTADDVLYPLVFDAVPPRQWDQFKDGFQYILNSVRVER